MYDNILEQYECNNLKITIYLDTDAQDPSEWGNSRIVQFRDNDWNTYEDLESSEYVTENGKLTPATLAKLRAGKMFTIDYRRYSNTDGGYYYLDGGIPKGEVDSRDVNGFIIFDDSYIKGTSYAERRKYAEGDLKTYTSWANGEVYGFDIEDGHDVLESIGGYIGDIDYCKAEAEATAKKIRSSATAKNARELHK